MKEITCFSSREWMNRLERNHKKEERVFLIRYKKHTGKESFNQGEAMNEAICFGWIDTILKRIDDDRYGVTFVKRNKNSRWSDNTFARAREMIRLGKMSKFGLEMFELGLTKKTYDPGIPKNSDMPNGLKLEVENDKGLKDMFEKLAPSYKRGYYLWISRAVRPETRMKSVKQCIENVRKNRKLSVRGKDVWMDVDYVIKRIKEIGWSEDMDEYRRVQLEVLGTFWSYLSFVRISSQSLTL